MTSWIDALQFGTVGEWVSGIGALAAVLSTIIFSVRAERARARETILLRAEQVAEVARHDAESTRQERQYADEVARRERAEEELRAERSEAKNLARTGQARRVFVWRVHDDGSPQGDGVAMHNGSDLPVFDVTVSGYEPKSGVRAVLDSPSETAEVVLPGKGLAAPKYGDLSAEVWVRFIDANGTRWCRSGTGELAEGLTVDEIDDQARARVQASRAAFLAPLSVGNPILRSDEQGSA